MSTLTSEPTAVVTGRRRASRRRMPSMLGALRPAPRAATRTAQLPGAVAVTVAVLLSISALATWLVLYALVFSGLQANRTNTVLYATLRENLSAATTPIGGSIAPGTPIALLQAPAAGIHDEVIVEGTSPSELRSGPGHLRTTPLPGQAGVAVLYGRSVTFGAPFGHVTRFAHGDRITVTTGQGTFTYRVDGVRRPGDPVPPPLAPNGSRLLLETTSGSGLDFGSATTVYVDATLAEGTVQPAPPGRPTALTQPETAMHGDTSVLLPLVLWLQAVLLVAVGIVWAWVRWGRWQAWAVGVPLLFAVLWGASSTALMAMPNLI